MNKKYIVQFLKEKKRGVYTMIVNTYADVICNKGVNLALTMIQDDLEKECGETITLNYFSLAKASAKIRSSFQTQSAQPKNKWEFKDAHEIPDVQLAPGKFKL